MEWPFETTCSFHVRNVQIGFIRKFQLVMSCADEYLLQKFLHKMVQAILIDSVTILLRLGRVANVPHKSNHYYCVTFIHPNQIVNGPNNLLSLFGHNRQLPGRPYLVECRKSHVSCFQSNMNQITPLQQEPMWIHTKPWLIIFHNVGARLLRCDCWLLDILCLHLAGFVWFAFCVGGFVRSIGFSFVFGFPTSSSRLARRYSCCLL
jgi:hypothetical protein